MPDKYLGIYIHIPFCKRKCNYCDFLSFPADKKTIGEYVDRLIRELSHYPDHYKDRNTDTVFIGGGTPTVIGTDNMNRIIEVLNEKYDTGTSAEISIETNPGIAIDKKILSGINRVSIGLQSACREELLKLGRIHDLYDFEKTFDEIRNAGIKNINVDIMSGLPGQTLKEIDFTIDEVLKKEPEHISAYSLIIEEGTSFYDEYEKGDLKLPDDETDRMIYHHIVSRLEEEGYVHYEISNFAKPGYECRHNIKYWRRDDYLGCGLGAASMIDNIRWKNTSDLTEYLALSGSESIREEFQKLSVNEQKEEFMFLGLRMISGISKEAFFDAFGNDIYDDYGTVIEKYISNGLLSDKDGHIFLTETGIDLSNTVMSEFIKNSPACVKQSV